MIAKFCVVGAITFLTSLAGAAEVCQVSVAFRNGVPTVSSACTDSSGEKIRIPDASDPKFDLDLIKSFEESGYELRSTQELGQPTYQSLYMFVKK